MFFTILKRVSASNVMLVTLLMPVPAILLGVAVLGEPLAWRDIAGAMVIAASLLVIDGRVLEWLRITVRRRQHKHVARPDSPAISLSKSTLTRARSRE